MLNAAKVQEEFRKKRKGEDDETKSKPKKRQRTDGDEGRAKGKATHNLKILPGESLAHFNRCALPRSLSARPC